MEENTKQEHSQCESECPQQDAKRKHGVFSRVFHTGKQVYDKACEVVDNGASTTDIVTGAAIIGGLALAAPAVLAAVGGVAIAHSMVRSDEQIDEDNEKHAESRAQRRQRDADAATDTCTSESAAS